jgi:MFS family permease
LSSRQEEFALPAAGRNYTAGFSGAAKVNPINLLLVSIGILLTGHGLQLSLLPLHASSMGWSAQDIGLTGSVYFAGFVVGCLTVPSLLNRAGSIRVIVCLSAIAAAVLMVLEMSDNLLVWCALRFVTGWSLAAIYATTEGWLNDHVEDQRRGRLLSIYIIVTLAGIAAGQMLLSLLPSEILFRAGALLMLLAILPVGLFCPETPIQATRIRFSPGMLKQVPAIASWGVLLGGITTGCIWTLAPLTGSNRGLDYAEIGWMMNAIIIGGAVAQFPLGLLSDNWNQAKTILATSIAGVIGCLLIPLIAEGELLLFNLAMMLFGGATLTLYALSTAIGQQASLLSRVETASILLLLNGIGSIAGPVIAGLIDNFTSYPVFVTCGLALTGIAIVSITLKVPRQDVIVRFEPVVPVQPELKRAA